MRTATSYNFKTSHRAYALLASVVVLTCCAVFINADDACGTDRSPLTEMEKKDVEVDILKSRLAGEKATTASLRETIKKLIQGMDASDACRPCWDDLPPPTECPTSSPTVAPFSTCLQWLDAGYTTSGVYNLSLPDKVAPMWCDMESFGGGWTLVAAGIGGNAASWHNAAVNSGDLNTMAAESRFSGSPHALTPESTLTPTTFKYSDDVINSLATAAYRFSGVGIVRATWFWSATECVYCHNCLTEGACGVTHELPDLSDTVGSGYSNTYGTHTGLGHWVGAGSGGQGCLHASLNRAPSWYMRPNGQTGCEGRCTAADAGCDVLLYVR